MQPDYRAVDAAQPHAFRSVFNESPKTLSTAQISHFNEHGFIEKLRLFDKIEADEHYANWTKRGMICRGEDTSGYWREQVRPSSAAID